MVSHLHAWWWQKKRKSLVSMGGREEEEEEEGKAESRGPVTCIPPSLTHTEILPILRLRRLRALLPALRNRVVGWPRALFDQLLAGTVSDVCFRHVAGLFSDALRYRGGWAGFWRGVGLALEFGILGGWRSLG